MKQYNWLRGVVRVLLAVLGGAVLVGGSVGRALAGDDGVPLAEDMQVRSSVRPSAVHRKSGEVAPKASIACFPGAYYRKAVSSQDTWNGIEGVVTLPYFTLDPARYRPDEMERHRDNPSLYLGGQAGNQEVDCGLTWSIIKEDSGEPSRAAKYYRPFWRVNTWGNAPSEAQYYFQPGDTVWIACRSDEQGKLTVEVALLDRPSSSTVATAAGAAGADGSSEVGATAGTSASAASAAAPRIWREARIKTALADPLSSFSKTFEAPTFGPGRIQEFKRVNAIDQWKNEAKPVQPTATHVEAAVWHEVHLVRNTPSGAVRVPFSSSRFTDMRCPGSEMMSVSGSDAARGGETVEMHPVGQAK